MIPLSPSCPEQSLFQSMWQDSGDSPHIASVTPSPVSIKGSSGMWHKRTAHPEEAPVIDKLTLAKAEIVQGEGGGNVNAEVLKGNEIMVKTVTIPSY